VRSFIFFFYVILMLMPYQVTLVPNYLVSDWLGLLNTRWAIIFPGAFAPFSVFLLPKFMRRIPASLIEAAKLDGAGEWQIFTRICLPQCRSALYSIAILVFIDYWNMVEQPIILLPDATKQPLSVYLSTINAGEVGLAFAVATIYMIPSLLLFLHGEEYLVEGIAHSGSIKDKSAFQDCALKAETGETAPLRSAQGAPAGSRSPAGHKGQTVRRQVHDGREVKKRGLSKTRQSPFCR
jgi:multiple sugar transport system permease protein